MSRPRSSRLTLSVLSIFLLFVIRIAAPDLAFADQVAPVVSPNSLSFSHIVIGTTSTAQTVTISDPSKTDDISFIHPGITTSAPFIITADTCISTNNNTIFPGKSCTVSVACKPTAAGNFNGTLSIFSVPGKITTKVPLSCSAVLFASSGDVLVAGGDSGALLGGVIPLATSTVSTGSAEIYNAIADSFSVVGSLGTAREATGNAGSAVVLPNHKTLIVGGSRCFAKTITSANGGPACGAGVFPGFECDALNTAELYDESTSTFTVAGSGSGGTMTAARSYATATLLADGTVLIAGGSSGSSFLGLSTPPTGCGPSGQVSENTAEIYNPATDTFTATASIPACPLGTGPGACGLPSTCPGALNPITSISESTNVVTVDTLFPNGLATGEPVTIAGAPAGYDGTFLVATASDSTFTYLDSTGGLAAGSGGAAVPFRACGIVDASATLLNDTTALVTGGDYIQFLGQSSPQAFIYVPAYTHIPGAPFWAQTNPMNVPRELAGIVKLPSGDVLVAGGLTGAAAACVGTPSTPVAVTTNTSAEIYNPVLHTWTPTATSMSVPRIASVELFTSGPDAGMAIVAGGVDAETPSFPTCSATTQIQQTTQTATDLFTESGGGTFTPTGALNQDRGAYASGIVGFGPNSGDLVVIGGSCALAGTLASAPIGSPFAGLICDLGSGLYYELFSPASGMWTVGASAPASTPAAGPASAVLP